MDNLNQHSLRWDENDFEAMQWHDCKIYAFAFDSDRFQLYLDIDFIVKWVLPGESNPNYRFWLVPATLVFKNVYDVHMDAYYTELVVENVNRSDPSKPKNADRTKTSFEYKWTLEMANGELSFISTGFDQYARAKPVLSSAQSIGILGRGGISFKTDSL